MGAGGAGGGPADDVRGRLTTARAATTSRAGAAAPAFGRMTLPAWPRRPERWPATSRRSGPGSRSGSRALTPGLRDAAITTEDRLDGSRNLPIGQYQQPRDHEDSIAGSGGHPDDAVPPAVEHPADVPDEKGHCSLDADAGRIGCTGEQPPDGPGPESAGEALPAGFKAGPRGGRQRDAGTGHEHVRRSVSDPFDRPEPCADDGGALWLPLPGTRTQAGP